MPAGQLMRVRRRRLPATPLNKVEKKQVRKIAKNQIRLRSELKHRAWLYPKTTYSELEHNKPFFLFGGSDNDNGLLNLAVGDESRPRPNGGGLPKSQPGSCREGTQIRLQGLLHNCILSGDNANKNVMVRMIMFSYPVDKANNSVDEGDILLQPYGTGAGQGFPNIFLSKNVYNGKGIRFLLDRTYQLNGQTSGAIVEDAVGVNWGLSGVKTFKFNKYFKNGKVIKYAEGTDGSNASVPATFNYGIMIIPYGSGVTTQDEKCGRLEILGDMTFRDM